MLREKNRKKSSRIDLKVDALHVVVFHRKKK